MESLINWTRYDELAAKLQSARIADSCERSWTDPMHDLNDEERAEWDAYNAILADWSGETWPRMPELSAVDAAFDTCF